MSYLDGTAYGAGGSFTLHLVSFEQHPLNFNASINLRPAVPAQPRLLAKSCRKFRIDASMQTPLPRGLLVSPRSIPEADSRESLVQVHCYAAARAIKVKYRLPAQGCHRRTRPSRVLGWLPSVGHFCRTPPWLTDTHAWRFAPSRKGREGDSSSFDASKVVWSVINDVLALVYAV